MNGTCKLVSLFVVCLVPATAHRCPAAEYAWQLPQAKVLSTGDLEWMPQPFVFEKGGSRKPTFPYRIG